MTLDTLITENHKLAYQLFGHNRKYMNSKARKKTTWIEDNFKDVRFQLTTSSLGLFGSIWGIPSKPWATLRVFIAFRSPTLTSSAAPELIGTSSV